jgi:hypothetical protein
LNAELLAQRGELPHRDRVEQGVTAQNRA